MFDLKTIATAAVTAVLVVMLSGLVGGNQSGVGGSTRFPNSDMLVKSFELSNGSATTSLVTGKICLTATEADGGTQYLSVIDTGWATSSTSCL